MMADFNAAYHITSAHEGGYIDHPDDRGGETIFGISKRAHPAWPGWDIVRTLKEQGNLDAVETNAELKQMAYLFYKNEYWDKIKGDDIPSQLLANLLFDISVNMGWKTAGKFLQTGLNILNRDEQLYRDISVDGWIGPTTLGTLEAYLQAETVRLLAGDIIIQMGARYHDILSEDPTQEAFARGWLRRVTVKFEDYAE